MRTCSILPCSGPLRTRPTVPASISTVSSSKKPDRKHPGSSPPYGPRTLSFIHHPVCCLFITLFGHFPIEQILYFYFISIDGIFCDLKHVHPQNPLYFKQFRG